MSEYLNSPSPPPPRFEIPMPNIISGRRTNQYMKRSARLPNVQRESTWAKILWPSLCWLLYALHLAVVSTFFVEMFRGEYDIAKHITIVATICGTYVALAYVHNNIRRYDDGRYD